MTVQPEIVHDHFDFYNLRCPNCGYTAKYFATDEFHQMDGFRCKCGLTWDLKKYKPKKKEESR